MLPCCHAQCVVCEECSGAVAPHSAQRQQRAAVAAARGRSGHKTPSHFKQADHFTTSQERSTKGAYEGEREQNGGVEVIAPCGGWRRRSHKFEFGCGRGRRVREALGCMAVDASMYALAECMYHGRILECASRCCLEQCAVAAVCCSLLGDRSRADGAADSLHGECREPVRRLRILSVDPHHALGDQQRDAGL